jgi:23S rRNA pseudouridine2605 synthase
LKTSSHIISVGRLDFNSEGLIVVTNDGELARCMELPETKLERTYRVRVYGTFTEEKLKKIRDGMTIAGVKYGPYWVKVENRYSL